MIAVAGGVDALVFTGGIGENDAQIRREVVASCAFLGLALDGARNASGNEDRVLSTSASAAKVMVVRAREDVVIARGVRQKICSEGSS
jgi:acetate kinase